MKTTRKILGVVLSLALLLNSTSIAGVFASQSDAETVAEDVEFDDRNIVLRVGILSDLHLTSSDTATTSAIDCYTNALAALKVLAGDAGVDALMYLGDYTNAGKEAQRTIFTETSVAALAEVGLHDAGAQAGLPAGCYHATVTKGEDTYHFITVETE